MDISQLISLAEEYLNYSTHSRVKKFYEGYVFDEEKSVKWNREEVERLNKIREEDIAFRKLEKEKLYRNFKTTVLDFLQKEYGYTSSKADKIYDFVMTCPFADGLVERLELLDELLELFG